MKKHFLFSLCLVLMAFASVAQSLEYSGVKRVYGRSTGEIYDNDQLKGYYTFYMVEKADKKNTIYQVDIADNNLTKTGSFEVVREKNSILLEMTFNGEYFLFTFFTKKKIEYVVYDVQGKELGSKWTEKLSMFEKARVQSMISNPEEESISSYSNGKEGFIHINTVKNDNQGYVVEALDNTAKVSWTYGSKKTSKLHEFADVLTVSDDYIAILVGRKKSMMTNKVDFSLIVLNAKTGDEMFEDDLTDKTIQLSLLNCFFDKDRNAVVLVGETYKTEDTPMKDQSTGLFVEELNFDGTQKSMSKYLWTKELAKAKKAGMSPEQKESEEKSSLYIHRAFRTKDGVLNLVAEQYRKQVSALGVASKVLAGGQGSGASAFEIAVMNMVVIQFNADMTVKNYDIIEKQKTRVVLPSGYGIYPPALLAAYIKNTGGFDYAATSQDRAADKYSVVFTDANRKSDDSKEKSDRMIGAINFKGSEYTATRTPINSDASVCKIRPGKPGYVSVVEYFRKAKKLSYRLESVK